MKIIKIQNNLNFCAKEIKKINMIDTISAEKSTVPLEKWGILPANRPSSNLQSMVSRGIAGALEQFNLTPEEENKVLETYVKTESAILNKANGNSPIDSAFDRVGDEVNEEISEIIKRIKK